MTGRLLEPLQVLMLVLVLLSFATEVNASGSTEAQERFRAANELLAETRYAEALAELRAASATGYHHGALYLNKGIAATRLDSLGLAKAYFIQSRQFPETARAATEGFDFVSDQLGRRGAQLPVLGWMNMQNRIYFEINYMRWLAVGIVLINIGVVVFILSWLRERFRPVNRKAGIGLAVTGLILFLASAAMVLQSQRYERGVQITREASVHASPRVDAEILQTSFEGFQFVVSRRESQPVEGWVRIRMVNGTRGWIRQEAVYRF